MAHCHAQGLLTLALCVVISEGRAGPLVSEPVIVTKEEDVFLSCPVSNVTYPDGYRVKWTKGTLDTRERKVILVRPKTKTFPDAPRVKWQANNQGQMSLLLTDLQKADEGLYSCEICHGWECEILRNISLRVKQCKVMQAKKVMSNTSVNLPCPVDVTQGPQNIMWEKLKGDNTETLPNGPSLAILSASSRDSGWYKCKIINGKTERCYEIKLQVENVAVTTLAPVGNVAVSTSLQAVTVSSVTLETRNEGSSGALIAVIVSVTIIGIVITIAVARLLVHNKHKNQRALQPTWHTQRPITGPAKESASAYEDFTPLDDSLNRVNSLYQDPDESMCTFHY